MNFNLLRKAVASLIITGLFYSFHVCANAHEHPAHSLDAMAPEKRPLKINERNNSVDKCKNSRIHVDCGDSPSVAFANEDIAVVFIQEETVWFSLSQDGGENYSPAVAVSKLKQKIYGRGENRPKIIVDQPNIYVSWTEKTDGMYTGNIKFARSVDMGKTFDPEIIVNDDRQLTSHRFDSMVLTHSGRIYMSWLDKRDKLIAQTKKQNYTGSAIYGSYSDDQGKTFSKNIKLADNSCECCRIAMSESVVNKSQKTKSHNSVAILWRHIFAGGYRDHALTTFDGSSSPKDIYRATVDHWKIDACPHHGPSIHTAKKTPGYHLAWFSDGEKNKGLLYAFVKDTNEKRETLHLTLMDASAGAGHPQIIENETQLIYAWKVFDGEKTVIKIRISEDQGMSWQPERIMLSTVGASDYPLLINDANQKTWLTWHTENEGLTLSPLVSVKHAHIDVKPLFASSFSEIKKNNEGSSHLIVLWSLYCAPCMEEMELIKSWHASHPDILVIFISTDGAAQRREVEALIHEKNIGHWQHWIFAEDYEEKLRFSIDPTWRGELPRSYLNRYMDNVMESLIVKGLIRETDLNDWFD